MRINLLPKEERPLKQYEVRWEFLVGLIALLLIGTVITFIGIERAKVGPLTAAYDDAVSREAALQRQAQLVTALRKDITNLEEASEVYQSLFVEKDPSLDMLPSLTQTSLTHLWIESLTWSGEVVELRGYTQEMTSLSRYLNYLNEQSEQVTLEAVYPFEETGFYLFSITAKGVGLNDSTLSN